MFVDGRRFETYLVSREIRELNPAFWLGNVMERAHLKDLGVDGRIL